MQALYAFFQSNSERVDIAEKNLLKNINAIYDLYIWQISYLLELVDFAHENIENSKNKYFPTNEEANPNMRFVNNFLIAKFADNPDYLRKRDTLKINWADQKDMIRRNYQQIRESNFFVAYMAAPTANPDADLKVLEDILDTLFVENEELQQYFEEKNVFWADDFDIACFMLAKTIKQFKNTNQTIDFLPKLFGNGTDNDEQEETRFIRDLFCKTIMHREEFEDLIETKVDNWEIDRIAMIDSLLLKMALTEFVDFESIPTKVTINEYIDISKMYSTPKSKIFINGILDKLLFDLLEKNKIKKSGRGLIAN
ncbi:MAG: transcription antitermination factor NusB [Bacteroidota bacterium]